jgi:hypothetical protein
MRLCFLEPASFRYGHIVLNDRFLKIPVSRHADFHCGCDIKLTTISEDLTPNTASLVRYGSPSKYNAVVSVS